MLLFKDPDQTGSFPLCKHSVARYLNAASSIDSCLLASPGEINVAPPAFETAAVSVP